MADLTEGAKHDSDKPRMDLLSTPALLAEAAVLTFGAKKYADHNWRKGINYSRCMAACLRHLTAFNAGEKLDPETGLSHLAHARCNLAFLLEYESNPTKYASFDDLYKPLAPGSSLGSSK